MKTCLNRTIIIGGILIVLILLGLTVNKLKNFSMPTTESVSPETPNNEEAIIATVVKLAPQPPVLSSNKTVNASSALQMVEGVAYNLERYLRHISIRGGHLYLTRGTHYRPVAEIVINSAGNFKIQEAGHQVKFPHTYGRDITSEISGTGKDIMALGDVDFHRALLFWSGSFQDAFSNAVMTSPFAQSAEKIEVIYKIECRQLTMEFTRIKTDAEAWENISPAYKVRLQQFIKENDNAKNNT